MVVSSTGKGMYVPIGEIENNVPSNTSISVLCNISTNDSEYHRYLFELPQLDVSALHPFCVTPRTNGNEYRRCLILAPLIGCFRLAYYSRDPRAQRHLLKDTAQWVHLV